MFGLGVSAYYDVVDVARCARRDNVAAGLSAPAKDSSHLIGRLTLAINDLGEPATDRSVVIDLGKPDVLERHGPKTGDGLIDGLLALANGFQQLAECFLGHRAQCKVGPRIRQITNQWAPSGLVRVGRGFAQTRPPGYTTAGCEGRTQRADFRRAQHRIRPKTRLATCVTTVW